MYNYPPVAPKQTFARIDFLRQGDRLVDKKATHNVKIFTKRLTNLWVYELTGWRVDKLTGLRVNKLASKQVDE